MRRVQRWRYYCDFCKKAGQSGFHMANHERHCTLNPARECRMCEHINGGSGADLAELLALLPDPTACMKTITPDTDGWITQTAFVILDDEKIKLLIEAAMPEVRALTDNCPVCIMAAFRQKKIPLPLVESFNFTQEMKDAWSGINKERNNYYAH